MRLSRLGEFNLIKRVKASFAETSQDVLRGIGDDAAAIKTRNNIILITTDMLIEGVHFDLSFATFYQLGYKAVSVNMSDIFAMGGRPRYFLIGLGIPKNYNSKDIDELYSGMKTLACKFGINIVGGDTCASMHGLVLNGILLGDTKKVITRAGAKPGDGIFVTNTLGDSAMGLILLKSIKRHIEIQSGENPPISPLTKGGKGGFLSKNYELKNLKFKIRNTQFALYDVLPLLKRHLMPEPQPLKQTSKITSMIDISDGLLIDLNHILEESNTGARIYMDKIPVSGELKQTAKKLGVNHMDFALKGGEDYALLFTAPADIKTEAFRIGKIIPKGRFLVDFSGREKIFEAEGYEHFKEGFKGSRGQGFK